MLLVSNMYPSESQPVYGIFVKRFEQHMAGLGIHFQKSVIHGRKRSVAAKLLAYLGFFFKTLFLYLKGSDTVYVHYANHSLVPVAIGRLIKKRPLVINAHGDDLLPRTGLTARLAKMLQPTFASADAVVVPSEYFKSLAARKISDSRIVISPSGGIDTQLFKPDRSRTIVRHQPVRFVYVSRIDEGKGWDVLTDALALLHDRTWLTVEFYGHGEQVDKLKEQLVRQKITDVASYQGALPQHRLVDIFNAADCLVFPSLNESLGLVGLEAMACGCPVIASDIPGLLSYVSPEVNGLVFKQGDAKDLLVRMNEFKQLETDTSANMRINALKTAQNYDGKAVAKRLANDLSRLLPNGFYQDETA